MAEFHNKQNKMISHNGKELWISRSNVVVGFVFAITENNKVNILVSKRTDKMTYPHKICAPCGYLDYDETLHQAMIREVYEEAGLYLPDYDDLVIFDNDKKPMYIIDDTFDKKQNISFLYLTVIDFREDMDKFPFNVNNYSSEESYDVKWLDEQTFWDLRVQDKIWAFNHNNRIADLMVHYRWECLRLM